MTIQKGPDLQYTRGDTGPITLRFKDSATASGNFNFSNWASITLTVDSTENPTDTLTQIIQFNGSFDADRESGLVAFRPPDKPTSEALTPTPGLFYDVQGIDPNTDTVTLLKGGDFEIIQDINKD